MSHCPANFVPYWRGPRSSCPLLTGRRSRISPVARHFENIKLASQGPRRTLSQKRQDIRIRNGGRKLPTIARNSHRIIGSMSHFSKPAFTKFESLPTRRGLRARNPKFLRAGVMRAQLLKSAQIGRCAHTEGHRAFRARRRKIPASSER